MGFHYRRLATEIEATIVEGGYKAGERLPSLRSQHQRTGLSITTVSQAYLELEKRGLVETREKSGFYIKPQLTGLLPLPRVQAHPAVAQRVAMNVLVESIHEALADPEMLPLGAAIPSAALLPVRQLAMTTKAVAGRYLREGGIGYGPVAGVPELQRQLAQRSPGGGGTREEIIITNGCLDAIQLCLRAVAGPGDTILVESPTFTCYLQLIEDLKMLVLELPTDPVHGLDFVALQQAVAGAEIKACILNPNFQNPLGFAMAAADKQQVVDFLNHHQVPIIEDDIYGDLFFGPCRPSTLKSFDRQGLVLYCSSFSKSLAPDLRVGWTMAGRFSEQVKRLKFNAAIASSKLNQWVVAEFLQNGHYDRHLRKLRTSLKNQVANTGLAVARYFPAGTKISAPQGGYILWVQLPAGIDGMAVFNAAKKRKIFILPGRISSSSGNFQNCIRISCGLPWGARIEEGIRSLGEIVGAMVATL